MKRPTTNLCRNRSPCTRLLRAVRVNAKCVELGVRNIKNTTRGRTLVSERWTDQKRLKGSFRPYGLGGKAPMRPNTLLYRAVEKANEPLDAE